jgi:hypothetical protein
VHPLGEVADGALPVRRVSVETLAESELAFDAVEEGVAHLSGQLVEGRLRVGAEVFGDGEQRAL